MTSSAEFSENSTSRFADELKRIRRPVRFVRPQKLEIYKVAEELERKFGCVSKEFKLPPNLLKEAEHLLITGHGDLSQLNLDHRKALPYILWTSQERWSEKEWLIIEYLAWAGREWRTAPLRLWRHYLLNMQPDSLATQKMARWLETRMDRLPSRLREFSIRWDLFYPERSINQIAGSLFEGSNLIDEIIELRVDHETFLKSACLLSALNALGQRLRKYQNQSNIVTILNKLLSFLGENPIHKMQGHHGLGEAAQKSLVEGLVIWSERQGDLVTAETLGFLHYFIGDPRIHGLRWIGIDPMIRQTVERWLAKFTIDAFFEVMRELKTDRDDMVQEREKFWKGYKDKISDAWLVTGTKAHNLAQAVLKNSFGEFIDGALPDHISLVLKIKDYIIFEMNKNGRTLFWRASDSEMPNIHERKWNRTQLKYACVSRHDENKDRFYMRHTKDRWMLEYENEILRRTGVSRSINVKTR